MQLYVFVLGGLALAFVFRFEGVHSQRWYELLTATLLAIGLYSSTFGISLQEARKHLRLIGAAVTVGVALKAAIIGCILSLVMSNPFGFVLGIAVAQIDPLSTAALQKSKHVSKRAKTILSAWSSFDDPVTVIMSLYIPTIVAALAGTDWHVISGTMQDAGLAAYIKETTLNVLFAGAVFALWMYVKYHAKHASYIVVLLAAIGMYTLVVMSLSTAVYFFWMLGVAIIGLFMRPPVEGAINRTVDWALAMAALLLGIILINGVNVPIGVILGLSAFGAQVLVGYLLTRKLSHGDRIRIALAQQNGITAIILALLFEPYYPGMIAIIAPAILTVNTVHAIANMILNSKQSQTFATRSPQPHLDKVKAHMSKI